MFTIFNKSKFLSWILFAFFSKKILLKNSNTKIKFFYKFLKISIYNKNLVFIKIF